MAEAGTAILKIELDVAHLVAQLRALADAIEQREGQAQDESDSLPLESSE